MSSERNRTLSFFDNLRLFLGIPSVEKDAECFQCKSRNNVINLGDGDFICAKCWSNWKPSYSE